MAFGKKRIYTYKCAQCGKQWRSSIGQSANAPESYKLCAFCRSRQADPFRDVPLSASEVDRILRDALLEEIRMPWEKRKRTNR
jgi:DNA-directed RNA polymerase subunit RPC12/RpoP